MRKLKVFNNASLDGFIADAGGDMSWAHRMDPEWLKFVAGNARGRAAMLFGRVTYDLMSSYWPTPGALESDPVVAKAMNSAPKYVFSKTLRRASWENTTLLEGPLVPAVRKLKRQAGPDLLIMGSGSLVAPLTDAGLIDEWQVVVNPLVLGAGRSMFEGLARPRHLELKKSRAFRNGNVVLWYAPAE